MSSAVHDSDIAYSRIYDPVFDTEAMQSFQAVLDSGSPNTITLSGHCPRCHGVMQYEWPFEVLPGISHWREAPSTPLSVDIDVYCRCGHPHKEHPDADNDGCGAFWAMRVERANGQLRLVTPTRLPNIGKALTLQRLQETQIERARKTAEGWRAALAGIIALVSTVSIIKGRESLETLPLWSQIVIASCLLAALTCAAIGTVLATQAANGPLQKIEAEKIAGWNDAETDRVLRHIRWTIALTMATLVLMAAAIGLAWFTPPKDAPVSIRVSWSSSTHVCGEFDKFDNTSLVLKTGDTVPLSEITKIEFVSSCP